MEFKTSQLNKRQEAILDLINKQKSVSVSKIIPGLNKSFPKVSRITVIRDINQLLSFNLIKRAGKGRGVIYQISEQYSLLRIFNTDDYFKLGPDQRNAKKSFNFNLINILNDIFTDDEKKYLNQLDLWHKGNMGKLSKENIKKEFERLVIEFSWKSSAIEGNTYTLLETESLIKQNKLAKGHKKEEAVMILNHKKALDYIRNNLSLFKEITIANLEDIHYLLVKDLDINRGLRKSSVGITGTIYRPLDNVFQTREALEKTCELINKENDIFAKAIILMIMIAYIQPFEDGNKRTGRLTANAILMAFSSCPLSYRSASEEEYKKAVILFYEQNNISYFKKIFIEQFAFAVENYFNSK